MAAILPSPSSMPRFITIIDFVRGVCVDLRARAAFLFLARVRMQMWVWVLEALR